jgi:hypothetical protein
MINETNFDKYTGNLRIKTINFDKYTGNLRIKTISFDILAQMWEGNKEEYDPKEDEPLAKFYIGKVGKYSDCSYIYDTHLRCASISVTFANGYSVLCTTDDVAFTDEEMTWEEYLPKIPKPGEDTGVYKQLTDAQKEFADKMFLQMIAGQHQLHNKDLRILLGQAVTMAQYRTEQYSLEWDVTWLKEVDE